MATIATRETRKVFTEADLLATPKDGQKHELVDGQIVVSPAGGRHEWVGLRLAARLLLYVTERELGYVFGSSMGYRLPSGNLRSPDVSFIAAERGLPIGFFDGAPDLAVEVLSPSDDIRVTLDKVGEYLAAGTRLVWVIDPEHRTAAVYRSTTDVQQITEADDLMGEGILPGFYCRLGDVLGEP